MDGHIQQHSQLPGVLDQQRTVTWSAAENIRLHPNSYPKLLMTNKLDEHSGISHFFSGGITLTYLVLDGYPHVLDGSIVMFKAVN